MIDKTTAGRREFLGAVSALGIAGVAPLGASAQERMPTRAIPGSGEPLPVIGLGSSKVVQEIATEGIEPVAQVLRTLLARGGRLVDTWPRNADNDAEFGRVVSMPEFESALFLTTKIDRPGKAAGLAQFRDSQRHYRRDTLDLVQIFSLTDVTTHWPTLLQLKDAGDARYIGVTVAEYGLYEPLEEFLRDASPDFVQVNYSLTERRAEDALLPMLADRGIAVAINRPFMNGAYFDRLENRPLPEFAVELGCESWAQFSLKYILAHPAVTCVLAETTNPRHMDENARASFGRLPDSDERRQMRELIDSI